ncbi:probable methyltransferase PMT16 [Impatiens glandulifera]|uniref:probable methyltransferase PMT16 n=1 Tax=Impatiens glandulifera TaxID=253017 RepID=UPI001FB09997|nr:probable methyltransferase PMT16 [Impatiens glandulifera]
MADEYYTPISKPNQTNSLWKLKAKIYPILLITFLCSISYYLGFWQGGGSSTFSGVTRLNFEEPIPYISTVNSNSSVVGANLDFSSHHSEDDGVAGVSAADEDNVKIYPPCDVKYSEYTPCQDVKRSAKFPLDRLIFRERHCPAKTEQLKCRVPAPYGYKTPFQWPHSRDLAWYANVPHKELTVEKAVQNWIRYEGDRFRFPGGGTQFPHGANKYIDDIGKLIDLKQGEIRTAVDTGCGVASWGAYLLSRNITAMSIAPRDSHEAQVQFALERGVPALIGVLASKRLPYPSRAFDMAHCSRCLIPWAQNDGVLLMEVDRILRPGGYWVLSGPPIQWRKQWKGWQRTREDLNAEQTAIEDLAKSLCWVKLIEKDDIAVWQKPRNHLGCKTSRQICSISNNVADPDQAWYTNMETCLTPVPDVSQDLAKWPARLNSIPPRIKSGSVNGVTGESFMEDSEVWRRRVLRYKNVNSELRKPGRYRNLLDMNANLGGFAAALINDPVWVMNVVPVEANVNTLGAVYERGLIGTYHSWCEAMSTYPRTYDVIHADSVFSLYENKCEMEDILLEMDRILRPEGSVIIRDDVDLVLKVKKIVEGLKWESQIIDHEDGPLKREKLLFAVKTYWTAPPPHQQN